MGDQNPLLSVCGALGVVIVEKANCWSWCRLFPWEERGASMGWELRVGAGVPFNPLSMLGCSARNWGWWVTG